MAKKYNYGHGGETDVISMTDQMHEAKEIIGATKWNNLSDKEKKSLTKYLIMKGDIEGEGEISWNKRNPYESMPWDVLANFIYWGGIRRRRMDKNKKPEETEENTYCVVKKGTYFSQSSILQSGLTMEEATEIVKRLNDRAGYDVYSISSSYEYADGGKTRGGKFQVGDKVIVNDTGYVTFFDGFDLSKPAVITEKRKVKTSRGIVYTYQIQTADGRNPFNSAIENMLTLAMADGGMMSNNIDDELEAFDIDNLDAFELMQFNHHLNSSGKVGALQILINTVEGDYSQLSTELAELAEKQTSNEEWDKESMRRYGYAHGGKTYVSRRKRTLDERAIEAVGADTWFQLDRETQAGVISEMLSMGALPQRMAKGAKVAKDFSVTYELMDGKKVTENYGTEEEMDEGIANFYIMNDVKDAIVAGEQPKVEEVKEVVKEAVVEGKPKKKSIFDTEKAVTKVAKSKQTNPVAHIAGIEREIQKYDQLKAIIKNAEAEKEIIGGIIKDLAKEKYLEIYKEKGERPTTITIESGGIEITFTPMDKYKTVTPEKETVLREYEDLLGTDYTFTFDNEVLDSEGNNGEKIGDIINDLIENSTDIPDNLKSKVVKMEKKVGVKKGTIKRLLAYDNPSEILAIIEPTIMLK